MKDISNLILMYIRYKGKRPKDVTNIYLNSAWLHNAGLFLKYYEEVLPPVVPRRNMLLKS